MIWLAVILTFAYLALDGTVLHTSRTVRRTYWAATSAVIGFWLSSLSNMDASWLVLSAVRGGRSEGGGGARGRPRWRPPPRPPGRPPGPG